MSTGDCSYCVCDGTCTAEFTATCACGGLGYHGWIGECARCTHETCDEDAACTSRRRRRRSATNNGVCDEGVDAGECPDGTDIAAGAEVSFMSPCTFH